MIYIKPYYYDKFQCIAEQCPATCCAGWQIVIDEEALGKYSQVAGDFGHRLKNSINWTEEVFYQSEKRCAFLNQGNLCDLYSALGPEFLCDTCRGYPRHIEEYEGIRELSLSLSCPVAAGMIVNCQEKLLFVEEEDKEEDEEFEEFDYLLFTQLEEVRDACFRILQNRQEDLRLRMEKVLMLGRKMQIRLDEGEYFQLEEELLQLDKISFSDRPQELYERRCKELAVFAEMEILQDDWKDLLAKAASFYETGGKCYQSTYEAFQKEWGFSSEKREEWETFGEQVMMFFVYTYFCGAVYDEAIYAKMALAVFATSWIQELVFLCWHWKKKDFSETDRVEMAYRFAREVEHSDINLEILERWLDERG